MNEEGEERGVLVGLDLRPEDPRRRARRLCSGDRALEDDHLRPASAELERRRAPHHAAADDDHTHRDARLALRARRRTRRWRALARPNATSDRFIRMTPSTSWAETTPPDEATRFERYAEELRAIQRKAAAGGARSRALHAKGNAGAQAELTVLPDLPAHARVGIFSAPGSYRAYVRFSNGAALRQPDRKPDVRGIAVKVLEVGGKKLISGMEDATTQDFLLIQSAATPFRNADEFVGMIKAAQNPLLLLPRAIGLFGVGRTFQLLRAFVAGTSAAVGSLATTRFFSALPIQWGAHAVHYALSPHAAPAPGEKTPEDHGADLAGRLREAAVTYDLRVQFYVDPAKTPIEDASVEWLERDAPFVTVGRLALPRQDLGSESGRRLAEKIETLSFDPWHAPVEFRPLGNMMRARNAAYRLSTQERAAAREPEGDQG